MLKEGFFKRKYGAFGCEIKGCPLYVYREGIFSCAAKGIDFSAGKQERS